MSKEEKILLILGIIIFLFLILSIYQFIKKNKFFFNVLKKSKNTYNARVVDKRHYIENNHNLFYVKFAFDDKEEEYLVDEFFYNQISINQEGTLKLKYNCFYEFR